MSDQDVIETSDVEDYAHELSQYRNSIERSRENDLNSAPRQAFGSGRHVVKRVKVAHIEETGLHQFSSSPFPRASSREEGLSSEDDIGRELDFLDPRQRSLASSVISRPRSSMTGSPNLPPTSPALFESTDGPVLSSQSSVSMPLGIGPQLSPSPSKHALPLAKGGTQFSIPTPPRSLESERAQGLGREGSSPLVFPDPPIAGGPLRSPSPDPLAFSPLSPQPHNSSRSPSIEFARSPLADSSNLPLPPSPPAELESTLSRAEPLAPPVVGGKYALRARKPNQYAIYSYEHKKYMYQLRHNPDAIVKGTRRGPVIPDSEDDEDRDFVAEVESQTGLQTQDVSQEIDEEPTDRHVIAPGNEDRSGENRAHDPIYDLSDTDEEDRALRKEIRWPGKAGDPEKRRRRKKPRRFPLQPGQPRRADGAASKSIADGNSAVASSSRVTLDVYSPPDPPVPEQPFRRLSRNRSLRKSPSASPLRPALSSIPHGENWALDAINLQHALGEDVAPDETVLREDSLAASRSPSPAVSSGSTTESGVEIDLPRSKRQALRRMMPMVMITKQSRAPQPVSEISRNKPRVQTGVLGAGQSRTRTGSVFMGDIKGDKESDEEAQLNAGNGSDFNDEELIPMDPQSDSDSAQFLVLPKQRFSPHEVSRPLQRENELSPDDDPALDSPAETASSVDDDDVAEWKKQSSTWSPHRPGARPDRFLATRPAQIRRERDLFDRMLSRGSSSGTRRAREQKENKPTTFREPGTAGTASRRASFPLVQDRTVTRPARSRPERGTLIANSHPPTSKQSSSRPNTLNIVTEGAKGQGVSHQVALTFNRQSTRPAPPSDSRNHKRVDSSTAMDLEHHVHHVQEASGSKQDAKAHRRKRKKRLINNAYTFDSGGAAITSEFKRDVWQVQVGDDAFVRAVSVAPESATSTHERRPPTINLNIGKPAATLMRQDTLDKFALPITRHADTSLARWPGHQIMPHAPHDTLSATPFSVPAPPARIRRHFAADCKVIPLSGAIRFGSRTYIGKFRLAQLLAVWDDVSPSVGGTISVSGDVFHEASDLLQTFLASLEDLPMILEDHLRAGGSSTEEQNQNAEEKMRAICRELSRTLPFLDGTQRGTATQATKFVLDRLAHALDARFSMEARVPLDNASLSVAWFLIELALRAEVGTYEHTRDFSVANAHLERLIRWLFGHGVHKALRAVRAAADAERDIDSLSVDERAAELWVCLLHLSSNRKVPVDTSAWFAVTLSQLMSQEQSTMRPPDACESQSREIFSLCALTWFSKNGFVTSSPAVIIPRSWDLIFTVVKPINLKAGEQEVDGNSSVATARDAYVKVIISRFQVLRDRWQWKLDDPVPILNRLYEIFRSRSFADLLEDMFKPQYKPQLARFLHRDEWSTASMANKKDTAFEILLKILLRAVEDLRASTAPQAKGKLKQLLSAVVPVGTVQPATRNPDAKSRRILSMVCNRLSAAAVAMIVDPSPHNVRVRMSTARKVVEFKGAPWYLRAACVRGMEDMVLFLGLHLKRDIAPALEWATEMADTLLNEFELGPAPQPASVMRVSQVDVELNLALLLHSLVHILQRLFLPKDDQVSKTYPDPVFLTGPWIRRLLSSEGLLKESLSVGQGIRSLIQTFLDARTRAMPEPAAPIDDSQESQEGYADMELDEDALAAFDAFEANCNVGNDKDDAVVEVLDNVVSYALHKFICRSTLLSRDYEEHLAELDAWVDCWARCVNVLISKNKHDWTWYMRLGKLSWEEHADSVWRRRVGLRFMYNIQQLSPRLYEQHPELSLDFLKRFMEAVVAFPVNFEHEYFSRFLLCDRFQYPLFEEVRERMPEWDTRTGVNKEQFISCRLSVIDRIATNLVAHEQLQAPAVLPNVLSAHINSKEELLLFETMLYAVKDARDSILAYGEGASYSEFVTELHGILVRHALVNHTRLQQVTKYIFPQPIT